MLESNRIDGFAGYEIIFDYALKDSNLNRPFRKLPTFDSTSEYVVGLKTNKKVAKIINDFDIGKRQIIKTGKFDKITQKWR